MLCEDQAVGEIMIKARRIGHMTLDTPDLQRQIDYFTQVIGLTLAAQEKDHAYLGSKVGHLAVQLDRAAAPRCSKLSFEVAPDTDFAAVMRELSAEGIKSEMRTDAIPGMPKALLFKDNKGTTIEIFSEWGAVADAPNVRGIAPLKLGHVAFQVADLQSTYDFYTRILGFRMSDWLEDWFVFMRCNTDHHTVNFIRGPADRLHHSAFELKDASQLISACDFLGKSKIPIIWGPLRHGPGHNIAIYFRDADDHVVENFIDLDQMKDEALGYFEPRPWHRDNPQRPKTWERAGSDIWGPPPTPDMLRGR
jgi:catechol 2,3-dioxygenase-like lactoylglutathione lyase family enzyme